MEGTLNKALLDSSPNIEATATVEQRPKRKVILYTPSVFVVTYVIFAIASSSGLLMCALWPLCHHLGGTKIELGLLLGMHAFGKAAMAQPMVTLTEKYKHGHALFVGMLLMAVGGFLFAFSPVLGRLPMLFIAQFILGTSSAAMGTARAYIVEQTRPNRRTYVLGRVLALDYCGHFVMTIVGVLLIVLGDAISTFMKFAVPGMAVSMMAAVALYLLYVYFQDIRDEDEMTEADFNPMSKQTVSVTPAGATSSGRLTVTTYRSPDIEQASSDTVYSPPADQHDEPSAQPDSVSKIPAVQPYSAVPTAPTAPPAADAQTHQEVYQLVMLVNFALRACMSVYATLSTSIILNTYNKSYFALGAIISVAGAVGVVQMLGFKQLWTNNFSDAMLLLIACLVLGFSQVFVVNWEAKDYATDLWAFVTALYAVFAMGFPVGVSAAVGAFSVLQRTGHQSAHHAQLIIVEAAAFIVVPLLSGVLEESVRNFASFSVIMIIMGACIARVMQMYEPLMRFTDRAVIGQPSKGGIAKPLIVLDYPLVRQFFMAMAAFLAFTGFATLLISIFGGRA